MPSASDGALSCRNDACSHLHPCQLGRGLVGGYAYPTELRAALTGRVETALNLPTLLRLLAAERIEMAVLNGLPAHWLIQEMKLGELLIRQPHGHVSGRPTQMAFSLRRPAAADALDAMNRGLAQWAQQKAWGRFEARYLRPIGKA
jgi:ABC-type amino acid transport substrate-binding protein